jgi:uncharacterized protein (TIGR02594 family)
MNVPRWLDIAASQVGVREVAGAAANPEILRFFAEAGRPDIASDEIAWCAAFAGACLARGGVSLAAIPAEERLLARSYLKIGTKIETPRPGAIAIFKRTDDPTFGHVGFVVGAHGSVISLLGGNQANSVSIVNHDTALLIGLRWPEAPATATQLAAKGSRIAAAASRQVGDGTKAAGVQAIPAPPKLPVPDVSALPAPDVLLGKGAALQGMLEQAAGLAAFAGQKWPLILLAVGAYYGARMLWDAAQIRGWRLEDHNTGANVQAEIEE